MARKILITVFIFTVVVVFATQYLSGEIEDREKAREEHIVSFVETQEKEKSTAKDIHTAMLDAQATPAWEAVVSDIEKLSESPRLFLEAIALGKRFEARSLERDNLLFFAGQLLSVNQNDPLAKEYLEQARKLHEFNIKHLSELRERNEDCVWNARLWYRKGIEYYRSLIFISKKERSRANDLIDQSIRNFEKIFSCYPKDRKTEVAIELLYKRAKESKSDSREKEGDRMLRLLPSGEIGPGTDGSQRERGRH